MTLEPQSGSDPRPPTRLARLARLATWIASALFAGLAAAAMAVAAFAAGVALIAFAAGALILNALLSQAGRRDPDGGWVVEAAPR